jgi:uncharacterized protein
MDFSNPFVGLTPGRKLSTEEVIRALRINVAAELDAINLYQALIDATDDENVKFVTAHIRDEEKEHVSEFLAAVNYLDQVQRQKFTEPNPELGIGEGVAQVIPSTIMEPAAEPSEAGAPGEQPVSTAPAFTVGSLMGLQPSEPAQPGMTVGTLMGKGQV